MTRRTAVTRWPGSDVSGVNLVYSDVRNQTRRFVPIGVAPSVHGLLLMYSSQCDMQLVKPHRSSHRLCGVSSTGSNDERDVMLHAGIYAGDSCAVSSELHPTVTLCALQIYC